MKHIYPTSRFYRFSLIFLFVMLFPLINISINMLALNRHQNMGFNEYTQVRTTYVNRNNMPARIQIRFAQTDAVVEKFGKIAANDMNIYFSFEWFLFVFSVLVEILIINEFFFTRIEIDALKLQIYYPLFASTGPLAKPYEVDLNSCKNLTIVRTTPLGPDLKDPPDINWRDRLDFETFSIPGYIFGNMADFFIKLKSFRPDLKVNFRKNSIWDNMREYPIKF